MFSKLLFPARCVICRNIVPDAGAETICPDCFKEISLLKKNERHSEGEFFEDCISVCAYKGVLRDSIIRYKFNGKRQYAGVYARLIANVVKEEYDGDFDFISWIPVSRRRKLSRGYDQAFLLASAAADELGTECNHVLKKIRHNKPQSKIKDESQRRANVLGVYETNAEISGKRILLIDDIVTTGATLGEASRVLLTAGAESVICATIAKAGWRKKT